MRVSWSLLTRRFVSSNFAESSGPLENSLFVFRQGDCERVKRFPTVIFSLILRGTLFLRFASPKCLTICPFFPSQWRSFSHDQSSNCKGQGCNPYIPLPIFPPSVQLILTQEDSADLRSEPGCAGKPALLLWPTMELDFLWVSVLRP